MKSRYLIFAALLCIVPAAAASDAAASASIPNVTTEVLSPNRVTAISTSLNHISIVQLPERIVSAAIGSEAVRMEYRDNRVLIQPLRPGVTTNLFVWTDNLRRTYEIMPAGDVGDMTYIVDEVLPSPPPPPPGPDPEVVQRDRDRLFSTALMQVRFIDYRKVKSNKKGVTVRITRVSEDAKSIYVHLWAENRGQRPYRILEPNLNVLLPTFAGSLPDAHINKQLTPSVLATFGSYTARPVTIESSTLQARDLQAGDSAQWIVTIRKSDNAPKIYSFSFLPNLDRPVNATAIF